MIVRQTVAGVIMLMIAGAGVTVAITRDTAAGSSWHEGYRACPTEDSTGPCFWDAPSRDVPGAPRKGRSFLVTRDGRVIYR